MRTRRATSSQRLRSMVHPYVSTVRAMRPALYYRLNEVSGTTAIDYSGFGNHGTYNSGITVNGANGPIYGDIKNRVVNVNGGATTPIAIPSTFTFPQGAAFTACFWQLKTFSNADVSFNFCDDGTTSRVSAHLPFGSGDAYFDFGGCCSAPQRLQIASPPISNNVWNHFACVASGTANTFQGVYLNGVLIGSNNASGATNANYTGGVIGSFLTAGFQMSGAYLSDFAVFFRMLSQAEIAQLYKAGRNYKMLPQ